MTHNQVQETIRPRFRKRKIVTVTGAADLIAPPASSANFPMVLATALTGAGETSVVVSTPIPTYVAKTGTIIVTSTGGTPGTRVSCSYSSYSGSTFTISSTAFNVNTAAIGANVQVPYSNRVVIDGYTVSGHNTNAAATTFTVRNKSTTASVLFGGSMAATSGTINIAANGRSIPAESGETVEINVAGAITGQIEVEVEGYILPATIPVCTEYTGVP